jgi:hypothetical protein
MIVGDPASGPPRRALAGHGLARPRFPVRPGSEAPRNLQHGRVDLAATERSDHEESAVGRLPHLANREKIDRGDEPSLAPELLHFLRSQVGRKDLDGDQATVPAIPGPVQEGRLPAIEELQEVVVRNRVEQRRPSWLTRRQLLLLG